MMSDFKDTLTRTLARARDVGAFGRAGALARPALRLAGRNPLLFLGAGVLALAGVAAFANRRRIAGAARPVLADAQARGKALAAKAKAAGGELAERVRVRRRAADEIGPGGVH